MNMVKLKLGFDASEHPNLIMMFYIAFMLSSYASVLVLSLTSLTDPLLGIVVSLFLSYSVFNDLFSTESGITKYRIRMYATYFVTLFINTITDNQLVHMFYRFLYHHPIITLSPFVVYIVCRILDFFSARTIVIQFYPRPLILLLLMSTGLLVGLVLCVKCLILLAGVFV